MPTTGENGTGKRTRKGTRKPLTDLRVRDFKHTGTGKESFLRDFGTGAVTGLAVRASKTGKAFVLERRVGGRLFRLTIGKISDYTVMEARERARRLAAQIDEGKDPREEEKARRAALAMQDATVADLWRRYLESNRGQWSERHLDDHLWLARAPKDKSEAGPLWPLMLVPVSRINSATLIQWAKTLTAAQTKKLKNLEAARATAKKQAAKKKAGNEKTGAKEDKFKDSNLKGKNTALLKSYIRFRAFWRWAYGRPEEFGTLASPEMFSRGDLRVLIPRSEPKTDVLQKSQLAPWFKAVGAISNPIISAYLEMLLLTGARREELAALKWSDVSFEWKSLHVKDKVEAAGRMIPLTPYCEHLLRRLPRVNEWVFSSGSSESGRMVEPRIAHKRALSVAGLPHDLSIHGLRRSFKSLSEWVELPVGIVAQIMGHKPSATAEKHYTVRPLELLAKWHIKLEAWILEHAGIAFTPEAVTGLRAVPDIGQ